ncbi:hypothetical protein CR513_21762, partial [Mucuna pruriens]
MTKFGHSLLGYWTIELVGRDGVGWPGRLSWAKTPDELRSILVKINIPLLDVIKQIPKYIKFLKELCIHKWKKMKGSVEYCQRNVEILESSLFHVPLATVPLPMPCWTWELQLMRSQICPCPSQRANLPSRLLCARYGGLDIREDPP